MPRQPHRPDTDPKRDHLLPVAGAARRAPSAQRTRQGALAFSAGLYAEAIARARLVRSGWVILASRARTAAGEIDIVAEANGLLAFIEVKTRPTLSGAARSLDRRQCARLQAAAAILLAANPHWPQERIRFDLILVARDGTMRRIVDIVREENDGPLHGS